MRESFCADRDNVRSTIEAKKARLEERIGNLERENVELLEWISPVECEKGG